MRPTQALLGALRRRPLTTKRARKGYYKGTGSGSMGRHTKHGGYIIELAKVRTYVVPATLADFKLTPFVTKNMEPLKGKFSKEQRPISGERYLEMWQREGGGL